MPVLFAAGACEIGLKEMGGAAAPSGERGTNVRAGHHPCPSKLRLEVATRVDVPTVAGPQD